MTGFSSLPAAEEGGDDYEDSSRWAGVPRILGPPWAQLPILTVGLLGVQLFWSVEMSYASPYLLSLGMSKSSMAVVFVAGPLSGLVMQPLIGVLADNSTSRFGRRRPYMIGGTLLCSCAMLLLGYTRPIAAIFTGYDNEANDKWTIALAVLAVYIIDFAINAVQAVDRAILVDTLPSSAQASGNAWAARMLGVGSVVGFFAGNIDLPSYFTWLGSNQLGVLSVIVIFWLLLVHGITAGLVKERVLLKRNSEKSLGQTFKREFKDIFTNIFNLPRTIRQIFAVQFFAWIGWFPILFYTSVYIGDLHKREVGQAQATLIDAEGTRLGARALFYSALISLVANVCLPSFVAETASKTRGAALPASPTLAKPPRLTVPPRMKVHLATLWAASHAVFAICMLGTFIVDSVAGGTLLIALTGLSWAITQWAPFSLLAQAILTEPAGATDESIRLADARGHEERERFLVGDESDDEDEGGMHRRHSADERRGSVMSNSGAQLSVVAIDRIASDDNAPREGGGGLAAKAGIILGIHNLFIVIPQFLVTGISAIVFAIFDPDQSVLHGGHGGVPMHNSTATGDSNETAGDASDTLMFRDDEADESDAGGSNSVVYIFRLAGFSAVIATVLCYRLARDLRHR
ncbi:major facilitator superfamily domain-containing protein [Schizophyllum amplum]|uniref:Major facilitator superfamily domain-containing protein n=1 Tax=Schizophyllum amplum TaxID=97359 RepID=A0A550CQB7_9AGAR|nr:major facilitator superfamily domain-containing protein [Auriculariopsis ampla]